MKIIGFSIESTKIEIDDSAYEQAKRDDMLDHELDVHLSDMDGTTLVIEPDGTVISPYSSHVPDLLDLVRPLLDQVPTWKVEQYVAGRRADEEV